MWCIVVSTTNRTFLKSIKLWNADNSASYPDRVWKDIVVKGTTHTHSSEWAFSDTLTLDLAANNGGLAGEIAIDATQACDLYMIEILTNKGDEYMQMGDMKFVVSYPDNLEPPYKAYFPAYLFNGKYQELPEIITETWTDGKFNMPMYAESNTTNLNFKNICGVLKITVKKDVMPSVKAIRVSSSNRALSGIVYVNAKNEAVLVDPSKPENSLTVKYTQAVTTSEQGTDFYVALPPDTYQELKIEISSNGLDFGGVTTKEGADVVVERNKIYSITPSTLTFTFVTTGEAKATINDQEVDVPWVLLWQGGPKFAKYNVGVTNGTPESYGGYYAWGGHTNNGSDYYTGSSNLSGNNDTATYLWGSNWRMPTEAELRALVDKCDKKWTSVNGVGGYKFTGKGEYASNSIFLPATGRYSYGEIRGVGSAGTCWASTLDPGYIYYLIFTDTGYMTVYGIFKNERYELSSVRAVLAE